MTLPLWVWSPLSYLGLLLVAPWYGWKLVRTQKYREGFWQRFTMYPPEQITELQKPPCIWVHTVSVGELQATRPLLEALRQTYPEMRIVVSTVTRTGQTLAKDSDLIDACLYLPMDMLPLCRRALRIVNPVAVLIVETELWPNFLRAVAERNTPMALLNARLSDGSFRNYTWAKPLFGNVLGLLSCVIAQSEQDRQRFESLGADASTLHQVGNIKFDAVGDADEANMRTEWRERFAIADDEILLVAGSTFAGEEALLCRVVRRLRDEGLRIKLVIAPRHVERVPELVPTLPEPVILRSTLDENTAPEETVFVTIMNTIGELRTLYAAADIVFMGKSLASKGGQNPIEPARWSRAIVSGPHTNNFRDVYGLFVQDDAVRIAPDEDALYNELRTLCEQPDERDAMGQRAFRVVEKNRGALQRTMQILAPLLGDAQRKHSA